MSRGQAQEKKRVRTTCRGPLSSFLRYRARLLVPRARREVHRSAGQITCDG